MEGVMPIRDLRCSDSACGFLLENHYQRKASDPDPVCPECGAPMDRMISRSYGTHSSWRTWRYTEGPRQWSSNIGTPDHD